jgi:hypothetical protein
VILVACGNAGFQPQKFLDDDGSGNDSCAPPALLLSDADATILDVSDEYTVDVTLIDAMLALTPEERLLQNDRMIQTIQELRDGLAAREPDDASLETRGSRR